MEVTCPQCKARQQLGSKEAALFWTMCEECGVIHGPATAQAGEVFSMSPVAVTVGGQRDESDEWVPANEMFEDLLAPGYEEAEVCSTEAEPWPPEAVSGTAVVTPPEDANQFALPASPTTQPASEATLESYERVEECSLDNVEDATHLHEPQKAPSEPVALAEMPRPAELPPADEVPPAAELPSPVESPSPVDLPPTRDELQRPAQLRPTAAIKEEHAAGARVMRIAPAWLILICVGLIGLSLFLGRAFMPASDDGPGAGPSAGVGSKTEAANQPRTQVPPAPAAPANPAPDSAKAAPAEESGAKAPAEEAGVVAGEPYAQEVKGGENFTAQVGSYSNAANAVERVSALRAAGFEARVVEAEIPGRGVWYRVQCGRFGTRREAARLAARLRAKGVASEAIIVEVQKQ